MAEAGTGGGVLGVYARLLAAQARCQAQYRASFAVDFLGSFLFAVVDLFGVLVLYRVTRALGGFGIYETLLMASLATCGFALADLAVGNIERIRNHVRLGQFDTVLVRPLGALGQLLVMDFAPRRFGRVLVTAGAVAYATAHTEIDWNPARALLLVATPLLGAVLFGSVFVATAVVAFWWVESGEIANALTYCGRDFTSYPLTVFGGAFRAVLGYAVGYAFVAYYPALALLDRPDPLGAPSWIGWCSPLAAAVAVGVATIAWRCGVRQYRSTGS